MCERRCEKCEENTYHVFEKYSDVAIIENSSTQAMLDLWVMYCEECLTIVDNETFVE